jgi:hypothetical protein
MPRHASIDRLCLVCILCFGCLLSPYVVSGEKIQDQEQDIIKAAYLRNALKFTHWPKGTFKDTNSKVMIAVAGRQTSFSKALTQAFRNLNFQIGNRRAKIIQYNNVEEFKFALEESNTGFQVLYVQESEKERTPEWLDAVKDQNVLLISDSVDFLNKGGMISLTPNPKVEKRYIYNIHLPRLKTKGIRLENQFLRLRSVVNIISK